MARLVFDRLELDELEPVETEFAELLPGLGDRRWRMTTVLFATQERRTGTVFSRPIWALSGGLSVRAGNPLELLGYQSVADSRRVRLAVIRDQIQHSSASQFGVDADRLQIFERYAEAAQAVRDGRADAYASVSRAHAGWIRQHPDWRLDMVTVPGTERPQAFRSFALGLSDGDLLSEVDRVLSRFWAARHTGNWSSRSACHPLTSI